MVRIVVFLLIWLQVPLPKESDVLLWRRDRQLRWSDFQGTPVDDGVHVAKSTCGIRLSNAKENGYAVEAYFVPAKSWYFKEQVSNNTLQHEQLHFDIARLYALKLSKRLSEEKRSYKQARRIFDRLFSEYQKFQRAYDNQTAHGTDSNRQQEWQRFVQVQLRLYEQ